MKKLIILSLVILLLCAGCEEVKDYNVDSVNDREFSVFIDDTTCVEYLYNTFVKKGGLTVRYNQDGTIKINEDCIKDKKNG